MGKGTQGKRVEAKLFGAKHAQNNESDISQLMTPQSDRNVIVAGWFCASRGEVDRMAKEFPDDATSAAVIGCGPVGLMAILAAQAQGAQKVSFAKPT